PRPGRTLPAGCALERARPGHVLWGRGAGIHGLSDAGGIATGGKARSAVRSGGAGSGTAIILGESCGRGARPLLPRLSVSLRGSLRHQDHIRSAFGAIAAQQPRLITTAPDAGACRV